MIEFSHGVMAGGALALLIAVSIVAFAALCEFWACFTDGTIKQSVTDNVHYVERLTQNPLVESMSRLLSLSHLRESTISWG